jgi:hypothetical protein
MFRGLSCSVLAWVAAAGCGHPPAETPAHTASVASPALRVETTDAPTAHAQRSPGFAPSALTPFANQVTDLLGAVLDDQPLPRGPLPLALWRRPPVFKTDPLVALLELGPEQ